MPYLIAILKPNRAVISVTGVDVSRHVYETTHMKHFRRSMYLL